MSTLSKEDLEISSWPPQPTSGMRTGWIPPGVRVVHIPTNTRVVCNAYRSQHQNKQAALRKLERILEGGS